MTMRTASSKKTRAVGIAHRHRNRICGVGNAQGAIPGDWTTTDAEEELTAHSRHPVHHRRAYDRLGRTRGGGRGRGA
jgi:hypothetical protein